ncbi:MAG: hypothetical protein ACRDMJ_02370 [Solirubrobacteraceae bacterium]
MRRLRRAAVIVPLALAACVVGAAPALASHSRTTTTTRVSASLSGVGKPARTRLKIELNGQAVYDKLVRSSFCHADCSLTAVPPGKKVVKVIALQPGGGLDVVLGLYSGGAHCCFLDQVFSQVPGTTRFVKAEYNFLDAGARLERLHGAWVFMSSDARIAEEGFTDFADSSAPIQILDFAGGRFVDITRRYPSLIRPDAARWLRAFRHNPSNNAGLIAGWAADEYLLGNYASTNATLNHYAAERVFTSALGLPHHSQTAFVRELKRDLRALGYVGAGA